MPQKLTVACPPLRILYKSLLNLKTRLTSTWQLLLERRMHLATKSLCMALLLREPECIIRNANINPSVPLSLLSLKSHS